MGNQESTNGEQIQDADEFLAQFTTVKKFQDPRFGDSTLVEHKENKQQCIVREHNSTDQEDHQNGIKKYQAKLQLQHPNIVKLVTCLNKTDAQFCSTFYKTYLIFEYISDSIEKEIMIRRPQQKFFSEGEIWNTMGGVIQGLAFLQKNNIPQGTIRVGTIYLNEEGHPKVTDPTVFQSLNNFATVCSDKDKVPSSVYLPPKLLDALEDGDWQPQHNEYKSDVFSLGMSLITMGLLEYCDDCYDYSEYKFYPQKLEDKLVKFSEKYTSDLTQFIMLMLKIEEEHRLDFIQLEDILISQPQQENSGQKFQGSYNATPENQNIQQKANPNEMNELFQQNNEINPNQEVVNVQQKQQPQQAHKQQKVSSQAPEQKQSQQPYLPNQDQPESLSPEQNKPTIQQNLGGQHSGQKHNFASPQAPQVQHINQNQSQPASFMHEDQPDSGATNMFAPKELVAEIPKPDENQGNELGAGTYRDDEQSPYKEEEIQGYQPQQQQQQEPVNQYEQSQQSQQNNYYPQEQPQHQQNSYQQYQQQYQQQQQYLPVQQQHQQQPQQQEQQQYVPQYQEVQNPQEEQVKHSQNPVTQTYAQNYPTTTTSQTYVQQQPQQNQQPYTYIKAINEPINKTPEEKSSGTEILNSAYVPQNQQYQVDSQINTILQKYSPPRDNTHKQEESHNNTSQKKETTIPQTTTTTTTYPQYQIPYVQSAEKKEYKPYVPYTNQQQTTTTTTVVSGNQYSYPPTTTIPATTSISLSKQFDQQANIQEKSDQKPQQNNPPTTTTTTTYQQYTNVPAYQQYEHKIEQQQQQQQPVQQQQEQQPTSTYQQVNYQQYQQQQPVQQQQEQQQPVGSQESGYTVETYQNGSRYEGDKLNNMRHGRGKFYYQDNGGLYDGEWVYNKMHGKGILYYASGKPAYDGDWVEDKFEGFGILYNEKPELLQQPFDFKDFDQVEEFWTKYDGEFKDDYKEGYGTLYISNGEKFSGTFKRDFVQGTGTYYTLNGDKITGVWQNNKFQPQ